MSDKNNNKINMNVRLLLSAVLNRFALIVSLANLPQVFTISCLTALFCSHMTVSNAKPITSFQSQQAPQLLPFREGSRPKNQAIVVNSKSDITRNLVLSGQLLKIGDYDLVVSISKKILELDTLNIEAQAHLAAAYYGLEQLEQYEAQVKHLKQIAPDSPALYLSMANVYFAKENLPQAMSSLKKGIQVSKDKNKLRMGLAALYLEQNQEKEATDQYLKILKQTELSSSDFLNASFALCQIELNNREYDKVIKRSTKVSELYPPILQGYLFTATAYTEKGLPEKAVKIYQKLIQENTSSPMPYQELSLVYIDKLSDFKNALRYAQQAMTKFPQDARNEDVLGWIYYKNNQYQEALKHFNIAIQLNPKKPRYYYHQGLAYQQVGNKQLARQAYENALLLLEGQSSTFEEELKKRIDENR